jgi:hypothetical protein
MLFCGCVVCLCGVDFVAEAADNLLLVINGNHGSPSFLLFVVPDAPVFRGGVDLGIAGVSGVVGGRGGAEVGLAIVPAVMVDVVGVEAVRHVDDLAVHRYGQPLFERRRPLAPDGVVCAVAIADVPFVPAEAVVVFGVHDGVLALREGDPAECVAVTQLSVEEQGQHGQLFQRRRYPDFDNELDDFPLPRGTSRSAEFRVGAVRGPPLQASFCRGQKKAAPHNWTYLRV